MKKNVTKLFESLAIAKRALAALDQMNIPKQCMADTSEDLLLAKTSMNKLVINLIFQLVSLGEADRLVRLGYLTAPKGAVNDQLQS